MLELRDVSKSYVSPDGGKLAVLGELDLRLLEGESLAVVGPSGSGKSTLLNLVGGLDRPDAGSVLLEGQDLWRLSEGQRSRVRNLRIGFIFQLHHLLPSCTVLENVLVPTLAGNQEPPAEQSRRRALALLERVGLQDRLEYRPGQLSGGQRQRVAVVRALINQPALLLADEPTGSLDAAAAAELGQMLIELNAQEHTALLVVTHSLDLAGRMARKLHLRGGRLEDSPA
jgi:ABC-type lipoprotein export system ATPase subunit